jgi:hypothetical protein
MRVITGRAVVLLQDSLHLVQVGIRLVRDALIKEAANDFPAVAARKIYLENIGAADPQTFEVALIRPLPLCGRETRVICQSIESRRQSGD